MALPSKLGPITNHIGGLVGSITSYGHNADAVVQQSFFEAAAPVSGPSLALSVTEGADTAAGTVALAISLSMAATEGADTAAGTVGLQMSLSLAATEGADTASSAVGLAITLSLAATEGADTCSATAELALSLNMSAAEGADTASGTLSLALSLALGATEGADTLDGAVTITAAAVDLSMAVTEGADGFLAAIAIYIPPAITGPAPFADRFAGPVKPLGVIGRLAIERQLAEDGQEIVIAITGLKSETITLGGEASNGSIVGYPVVRQLKSGSVVPESIVQNGVFVIRVDDLKPDWENIAFIKSGNDDRVSIEIESLFDYIERPVARAMTNQPMPISGWGLGEWGNMEWGG